MKISFDLDDTLICHQSSIPKEPYKVPWPIRYWQNEPLRLGTIELMNWIRDQGDEIGIYTTSYRTRRYIQSLFYWHKIKLSFTINQYVHDKKFKDRLNKVASKMPSVFGIDLHIDDDHVLYKNSFNYGFNILRVDPLDLDWVAKVKSRVCVIKSTILGS